MINIGIVGCGDWAFKIVNELNINKKFNLKAIVCRKKKDNIQKFKVFDSVKKMIESGINDSIFVAADPKLNLEVIKLIKNNKIPVILEKPVSNSFENITELKKIIFNNKLIVFPNLTNYFSETFFHLKRLTDINYKDIKEIVIYEGGFGPFRKNIHPVWDWGFHSLSLLYLLFKKKNFSQIKMMKLKSNNLYGKGIVSKFSFKINREIDVKIITGNLFKKKIRKIKINLKNGSYILNDMIKHELYMDEEIIFKNNCSPITSLLINFEQAIRLNEYGISKELIDASCKTTKFLEKFFKC